MAEMMENEMPLLHRVVVSVQAVKKDHHIVTTVHPSKYVCMYVPSSRLNAHPM